MRFESIRIHNFGPFRDVDIDLRNAPGPLVAVTGANGAGKSTLLELFAAALYRQCKTRGPLSSLATARDSLLEVGVDNGRSYVVRQTADAAKKRAEALILEHGAPVLETSRVSDADAFVEQHFPRADVLYSTQFMPQKSGGFLDLSRAERTRVMLWLLRIERFETMAERARENARAAKANLVTARARLDDATDRYPVLEQAVNDEAEAERAVQAAQTALQEARTQLKKAQESAAQYARAHEIETQRTALAARIRDTQALAAELRERIQNNHMLLAKQAHITAACEHLAEAQAKLAALQETVAERTAEHRAAVERQRAAASTLETSQTAFSRAQERVAELEESLQDAAKIERAKQLIPRAKQAVEASRAAVTVIEQELERSRTLVVQGKDTRLGTLRSGLKRIEGGVDNPQGVAGETLVVDNMLEREAAAAPERVQKMQIKLRNATTAHERAVSKCNAVEKQAARAADVERMRKQLDTAKAALRDAHLAAGKDAAALQTAQAEVKRLATAMKELGATRQTLDAAIQKDGTLASYKPQLDVATARLEELTPQLARAESDVQADQVALAALPTISAPTVDIATCEAAVSHCDEALARAQEEHAEARSETTRAREGQTVCGQLREDVTRIEGELADWTRLAQDLGKDGLQALEIDAAIPELNAIANDLLHSCHGPRFTVEVFTDRLNADGTRTVEDLDVRVIDTRKGRDATADSFSGGEQVILSEAISLALTVLACRRSGLTRPTLVRDESGAALDPKNGPIYIAMLRRAAEAIGADKVLFVTHNPQLHDLADSRIHLDDGNATLCTPD